MEFLIAGASAVQVGTATYLRPVVIGLPPVPVRIEAQSRFGAVRIHLVSVETAGEAQKADLSR